MIYSHCVGCESCAALRASFEQDGMSAERSKRLARKVCDSNAARRECGRPELFDRWVLPSRSSDKHKLDADDWRQTECMIRAGIPPELTEGCSVCKFVRDAVEELCMGWFGSTCGNDVCKSMIAALVPCHVCCRAYRFCTFVSRFALINAIAQEKSDGYHDEIAMLKWDWATSEGRSSASWRRH